MKRFVATILALLYLTVSSGATVDFHYCMGKFIGWDLTLTQSSKCDNCGMSKENKKGCCNDKHQTFEVKKDQIPAQPSIVPFNTFHYLTHNYFYSFQPLNPVAETGSPSANSPPDLNNVPSRILHCVFRI